MQMLQREFYFFPKPSEMYRYAIKIILLKESSKEVVIVLSPNETN